MPSPALFTTTEGLPVPAVDTEQMREVDRLAVQVFQLGILQMMENAGRNLAFSAIDMLGRPSGRVVVLAGPGGNGGGGLCAARHLRNHGLDVQVALSRPVNSLGPAAAAQWRVLAEAGTTPVPDSALDDALQTADLVLDALIGYSLQGAPRGASAAWIERCNRHARRVLSLDVPSGVEATSGEAPGVAIQAERTLTLALPKTGLANTSDELFLADIGIPPQVYLSLNIRFDPFFAGRSIVGLTRTT